jgi:hypothetical protein
MDQAAERASIPFLHHFIQRGDIPKRTLPRTRDSG